jgi:hypothetical protein
MLAVEREVFNEGTRTNGERQRKKTGKTAGIRS